MFLFTSCEKLILEKKISKKLYGTWRITDIKITWGIALNPAYNFKNEIFTFKQDNEQELVSAASNRYTGKWYVFERKSQGDCYTAPAGNTVCRDIYTPIITADTWIPTTNEKKARDFEDIKFTSPVTFTAVISPNPVASFKYTFTKVQ